MKLTLRILATLLLLSHWAIGQSGNYSKLTVRDSIYLNGRWINSISTDSAIIPGQTNVLVTERAVLQSISPYLRKNDTAHLSNRIDDRLTYSAAATIYIPNSQKAVANGVATLGSNGKIPSSQIPALAISETFVVATQAAMLALVAETGDVAVRTDLSKSFILSAEPASMLGNWQELLTPTAPVQSVNGQTGNVNLTTTNVSEGTNMYWTTARGDVRYPLLSGAYSDPTWLTGIDWSKILNAPPSFPTSSNLQTITTNGNATNQRLVVVGQGGTLSANAAYLSYEGGVGGRVGTNGALPLYLVAGGSERVTIGAAGGIDINTTTSVDALTANSQSSSNYNIKAVNSTALGITSGGTLGLRTSISPTATSHRLGSVAFGSNAVGINNASSIQVFSDSIWASNTHNGTRMSFYTTLNASGTPSERVRIDNWGNVGIGTGASILNQWERLRVVGNAHVTGTQNIGTIPALGTSATNFLTSNGGQISSRTPAEALSDMGGLGAAAVIQNQNVIVQPTSTFSISGMGTAASGFMSNAGTPGIGRLPHFRLHTGGVARWSLNLGNAEAGSNSGSDFSIGRSDDSGGYLNDALTITRATGAFNFPSILSGNNSGVTVAFVPARATPAANFLTSSSGLISYRTPGEVLSDIGAAPATGSGNYLNNQATSAQTGQYWITSVGRTNGSFQVAHDGTSTMLNAFTLINTALNRGVNLQLNEDNNPGLSTWIHNGTSFVKRAEQFANDGRLAIYADNAEGINLIRQINAGGSATGGLRYNAWNASSSEVSYAQTWGIIENNTTGAENGSFAINTRTGGSLTQKMLISANGTTSVFGDILLSKAGGSGLITIRSTSTGDAVLSLDVSGVSNSVIRTFRTTGRTGFLNNANEAISIGTNGFVGINNTNPQLAQMHITNASTSGLAIQNTAAISASTGGFLRLYQSGTPTAAGHRLGGLLWGTNPTGSTIRVAGQIDVVASEPWTDGTSHPADMKFLLTPSGAASPSEIARFYATGKLKVNNHITSSGAIVSGLPTDLGDLSSTLDANINFVVKNENTGGGVYTTALQALNGSEVAVGRVRVDAARISIPEVIMQGGMSPGYAELSSNTTLGNYTNVAVILSGTTQTLPTIASCPGREYTIFNAAASGSVIVAAAAGQTINGAATYTLTAPNKTITIWNHGGATTAWHIKYSN